MDIYINAYITHSIYALPHACAYIGKSRANKQNKQAKIKLKIKIHTEKIEKGLNGKSKRENERE